MHEEEWKTAVEIQVLQVTHVTKQSQDSDHIEDLIDVQPRIWKLDLSFYTPKKLKYYLGKNTNMPLTDGCPGMQSNQHHNRQKELKLEIVGKKIHVHMCQGDSNNPLAAAK